MLPYIALITVPILFQHINVKKGSLDIVADQRKNELSMAVFWILLLLMLLLRHEIIGLDLEVYKIIFSQIAKSTWSEALGRSDEVAWSALNKIVSLYSNNFRIIMVISAILSTVFIARAYVKYSKDTILSIAIYMNASCFIMIFSGLRQSISISLGFLAFEFVRRKKIFTFLLIVAIAMTFHISAFMLLFMYPLYHIRVRRWNLIFIVPLLFIALLYNQPIFTFLGKILSSFTEYDTTIKETGAYAMLILFAMMAILAFLIPDESKLDADTIAMRSFLLMAVVLQMFAPLHSLAMRMNYYYIVFIPLVMSRVIEHRNKDWSQLVLLLRHAMVIFFIVYFFMTAPEENALKTFPYYFYWEDIYVLH